MTVPFGLLYDFRNPSQKDWAGVYNARLDQIAWAEKEHGYDAVWLSEHHFAADGYSPSLPVIAAAIAQRTERMLIGTNLIQLPLHHPLNVAEDALTVDAISNGRFRLGVGNGYRRLEFEGLGTTLRHRKSRVEEAVPLLRKAFAGEHFAHEGRHWSFPEIEVTPGPIRPGGPGVWIGGNSEPAIDRVARLGDGYLAVSDDDVRMYKEALERHGRSLEEAPINRVYWAIIADDPQKALADVGEYMLFQVNKYIEWGFLGDIPQYEDPQKAVDDGIYRLWDGDEAVRTFVEHHRAGVAEFQLFAAWPGEPLDSAAGRIEYVANEVIPRVREQIAAG